MVNGGIGLLGEAGPEAVMPLRRGPDGKLGIASAGGAAGGNISFGDIHITLPEGTSAENAGSIGREIKSSLAQIVDERLRYHTRSRGMLAA